MTPEEIAQLRELEQARTRGEWRSPWQEGNPDDNIGSDGGRRIVWADSYDGQPMLAVTEADAAYIVAACNALPKLLQELDECVTFIKGLKDLDPRLVTFDGDLIRNDVMYKRVTDAVRANARDFLRKIGVSE